MPGESQHKEYQLLIVPGMMGSRLRKNGRQVWPAWMQGALGQLRLGPSSPEGLPEPGEVLPDSILERLGFMDLYRSLIDRFDARDLGDSGVKTYVDTFPYDWRLSIATNSNLLARKIAAVPPGRMVVVIAHSLGGLVTKHCLVTHPEAAERTRYLFSLGTPWLGVPEAYVSLQEGLGMHFLLFASMETQRAVAQTMPSVYQLLPSRAYFSYPGADYYLMEYGSGSPLDYRQTSRHIDRFGYGSYYTLYNTQALQHSLNRPLVNSRGPIPHFAVGGTGRLTLESLQILADGSIAWRMESRSGDGTVPHKSVAHPGQNAVIRYVEAGHLSLPTARPVGEWVQWVLTGKDGAHPEIDGLLESPLEADGEAIFIHSDTDVLVTDRDGYLHAGVLAQYVINHAPDVVVSPGQDQARRVTLPADGRGYGVYFKSAADIALTLRHVSYRRGRAVKYAVFWGVPLKVTETAELVIRDGHAALLLSAAEGAVHRIEPQYGGLELYQNRTAPTLTAVAGDRVFQAGWSPVWLKREDRNELHLQASDSTGAVRVQVWQQDRWVDCTEPLRVQAYQLLTVRARAMNISGNVTEGEFVVGWANRRPTALLRLQGNKSRRGVYVGEVRVSFGCRVKAPVRPAFIQVKLDDQPDQILRPDESLLLTLTGEEAYRSYRLSYVPVDGAGNRGEPRSLFVALAAEAAAETKDAQSEVTAPTENPVQQVVLAQAISVQTGGAVVMRHEFGARLRQLRTERKLFQRDLEKALNLRPGAASQYERGLREPGFDLLLTIAVFFDVSVDYLLGRPGATRESANESHSL